MKFKKFLKYVFSLVFLVFMVFLYRFSLVRNSQKKVIATAIEFTGGTPNFLTKSMVNKLLIQNQISVKNQPKSVINLYDLENAVLKNSYVEESAVFLTPEGVLKSIIKQRTVLARVVTKNNSYYVDKEGVKVPLSKNYTARVPLITGIKNDINLNKVMPLLRQIIADDFLQKEIVGIHQSDVDNYQLLVRSGNYKIEFGKLEAIQTKFKKLKAFYSKAFLDKTIEKYKTINLKYHNQVVCAK